ncbi:MAG: zinc ribbon domain-containing protein [Phycisphaerales bacterium]
MDVTEKLLRVYLADKQLRGLQARLKAAEKFLTQQDGELTQLETQRKDTDAQVRQFQVAAAGHEGEMKRIDARAEQLRVQMETAQTNKAYQAFLVELNTHKVERDKLESSALELMTKVDGAKQQLADLDAKLAERKQLRGVAVTDRDKRADEIRDRVAELQKERAAHAAEVPKEALAALDALLKTRGDGAMAAVEAHDVKRHEYACSGCTMFLPIDSVAGLISGGKLTKCVSCGCILFLDEEFRRASEPVPKTPKGKGKKSAAAEQL